ncbi:TPA_asm: hypothetical protein vir520_00032 [Caudoviricetes sp. vir520]|nr:TPA_asm: hypothetical protein vir520_00032 [Caudoviricetes sp. vir520]
MSEYDDLKEANETLINRIDEILDEINERIDAINGRINHLRELSEQAGRNKAIIEFYERWFIKNHGKVK